MYVVMMSVQVDIPSVYVLKDSSIHQGHRHTNASADDGYWTTKQLTN